MGNSCGKGQFEHKDGEVYRKSNGTVQKNKKTGQVKAGWSWKKNRRKKNSVTGKDKLHTKVKSIEALTSHHLYETNSPRKKNVNPLEAISAPQIVITHNPLEEIQLQNTPNEEHYFENVIQHRDISDENCTDKIIGAISSLQNYENSALTINNDEPKDKDCCDISNKEQNSPQNLDKNIENAILVSIKEEHDTNNEENRNGEVSCKNLIETEHAVVTASSNLKSENISSINLENINNNDVITDNLSGMCCSNTNEVKKNIHLISEEYTPSTDQNLSDDIIHHTQALAAYFKAPSLPYHNDDTTLSQQTEQIACYEENTQKHEQPTKLFHNSFYEVQFEEKLNNKHFQEIINTPIKEEANFENLFTFTRQSSNESNKPLVLEDTNESILESNYDESNKVSKENNSETRDNKNNVICNTVENVSEETVVVMRERKSELQNISSLRSSYLSKLLNDEESSENDLLHSEESRLSKENAEIIISQSSVVAQEIETNENLITTKETEGLISQNPTTDELYETYQDNDINQSKLSQEQDEEQKEVDDLSQIQESYEVREDFNVNQSHVLLQEEIAGQKESAVDLKEDFDIKVKTDSSSSSEEENLDTDNSEKCKGNEQNFINHKENKDIIPLSEQETPVNDDENKNKYSMQECKNKDLLNKPTNVASDSENIDRNNISRENIKISDKGHESCIEESTDIVNITSEVPFLPESDENKIIIEEQSIIEHNKSPRSSLEITTIKINNNSTSEEISTVELVDDTSETNSCEEEKLNSAAKNTEIKIKTSIQRNSSDEESLICITKETLAESEVINKEINSNGTTDEGTNLKETSVIEITKESSEAVASKIDEECTYQECINTFTPETVTKQIKQENLNHPVMQVNTVDTKLLSKIKRENTNKDVTNKINRNSVEFPRISKEYQIITTHEETYFDKKSYAQALGVSSAGIQIHSAFSSHSITQETASSFEETPQICEVLTAEDLANKHTETKVKVLEDTKMNCVKSMQSHNDMTAESHKAENKLNNESIHEASLLQSQQITSTGESESLKDSHIFESSNPESISEEQKQSQLHKYDDAVVTQELIEHKQDQEMKANDHIVVTERKKVEENTEIKIDDTPTQGRKSYAEVLRARKNNK